MKHKTQKYLPRQPASPKLQRGESSAKAGWSGKVTKESNALDLEAGVFTWDDPVKIAESLKESAEWSLRKKGTPYQSAMSMLNFYINRAGKNLPLKRRRVLEQAKKELKKSFVRFPKPNNSADL